MTSNLSEIKIGLVIVFCSIVSLVSKFSSPFSRGLQSDNFQFKASSFSFNLCKTDTNDQFLVIIFTAESDMVCIYSVQILATNLYFIIKNHALDVI